MTNSNDPHYFVEDAAKVVFDNINSTLQSKLTLNQIEEILDLEMEFLQPKGLGGENKIKGESITESIQANPDEIAKFLVNHRNDLGINLNYDEFMEILDAELIYMRQIGIMD